MDRTSILKALADNTRMKILTLLLHHNYCVRALARELNFSEATISQHLKVLREARLIAGEKRGYFMHYDVERKVLRELACEIEAMANIKRQAFIPEEEGCLTFEQGKGHVQSQCSDVTKEFCHGKENGHHCHHNESGK